jgi:hypothetical protein
MTKGLEVGLPAHLKEELQKVMVQLVHAHSSAIERVTCIAGKKIVGV